MENQEQKNVNKKSAIVDVIVTALLLVFLIAKWVLARYNNFYSECCGLAFNVTFCVFALIQAFKFKKGNILKTLYFITAGLFAIATVLDIIDIVM